MVGSGCGRASVVKSQQRIDDVVVNASTRPDVGPRALWNPYYPLVGRSFDDGVVAEGLSPFVDEAVQGSVRMLGESRLDRGGSVA